MNFYYEYNGKMPLELIQKLYHEGIGYDYDPTCQTITLRHVGFIQRKLFERLCKTFNFACHYHGKAEYNIDVE
ncbi:MAG: hypothetical protein NC403_08460 [Muribaculaceae bacterium]|nr:hypothetical protein [Muribaculaceae bacterium]